MVRGRAEWEGRGGEKRRGKGVRGEGGEERRGAEGRGEGGEGRRRKEVRSHHRLVPLCPHSPPFGQSDGDPLGVPA
jgi:hypothetical protein